MIAFCIMSLVFAGMAGYALGYRSIVLDYDRTCKGCRTFAVAAFALSLMFVICGSAVAAPVAEIHDATLTNEHAKCPRLHLEAVRRDFVRGCWTIGEHTREVVITWADGRVDRYSEMRFEIYGRVIDDAP
jgi:hypothetical protein